MDEDQTSLDNVDLYEDLHELFSSTRSVTDCSLSYAELQEKLKEKESQLNALKLEVKQLGEQNICLKKNISCLFKTAKNELQYKEKQINLLHARLLKKPGRKARKKKTPKTNTALVAKTSDQSHNLNTTESNKTTSTTNTNSTTVSTNNEAITMSVTSSSGVTQCNASSSSTTEVILNSKEVVDVPPTNVTSDNETNGNGNKMSIDVPVVTEDGQALIMANSSNEETLNNDSLINDSLTNVPAELSVEVESPHRHDCCDNVSETVSVSDGEILSENEERKSQITGSCDAHHDTNISFDHNVLSHQVATSTPQSDQSQNQGNHRHKSGQSKNQGNHKNQSGQSQNQDNHRHQSDQSKNQGNHENQSGQSQNQGNHRGHCDQSTHHSGRHSAKTTVYDRPASQGKSRPISEPHGSRHTTRDAARRHQSLNESRESSSHISSKSRSSPRRSHSSGSQDSLRGLHHSSSGSHDSSKRLNCSSSRSHDPLEMSNSPRNSSTKSSHSLGTSSRRSSRSHDSSHDSSKPLGHGSHDPLHHSSSGPHNSSRSDHGSKELLSSSERRRHSSTLSCDSSRTLHRNSPQGTRRNSTPDRRRTSDSGVTRGSKRRNSNQDGSRDTLAKRNRS